MPSAQRACLHALLAAILITALCGLARATSPNTIKEVTVASDLRRVVIKCSEPVGQLNTFRLDRPPRLVVDIAGTRPDRNLKPERPEHNGGLNVQVGESRTGAHVVLDFGGAPVPELRIRRIGTYVIVFMEEWKPLKQSAAQAKSEKKSPPRPVPRPTKATVQSVPENGVGRSDLTIKSARVVDGLIVLTVTDRQHPEKFYRIDLGVNFEQMGFVSAGIYPLQAQPREAVKVTEKGGAGRKIGPRREAPRVVQRGPQGTVPLNESPKTGSRSKRAAIGPRRSPQPQPARGPVSSLLRNSPRPGGWTENRFPHHSVVESAQAKLFAYRQAPLVHPQACGFTPRNISQDSRPAGK